jgi:fructose/tagatose bisphosphate aldolase
MALIDTHLVMHGSSSVPQEQLEVIRAHGVRKVNIDTDIRLAMTGAMRRRESGRALPASGGDFSRPLRNRYLPRA